MSTTLSNSFNEGLICKINDVLNDTSSLDVLLDRCCRQGCNNPVRAEIEIKCGDISNKCYVCEDHFIEARRIGEALALYGLCDYTEEIQ